MPSGGGGRGLERRRPDRACPGVAVEPAVEAGEVRDAVDGQVAAGWVRSPAAREGGQRGALERERTQVFT